MSGTMNIHPSATHDWALVLAGGQGRRIAHLTRTGTGVSVPKQFCSLGPGCSLAHAALRRASIVAPPERTLVVVTERHRTWWRALRDALPADNVLVQPEQRGTGIGILHPLLDVLRRDPAASLAILPSDHYFRDESGIADGLRTAMQLTRKHPGEILLLGFEPEEADPDLGYIVPAAAYDGNLFAVDAFVEKPGADRARGLVREGALCNSFIVASDAHALLALFERHCPAVVERLRQAAGSPRDSDVAREALARLFREIPSIDFSTDVIAKEVGHLRVLRLPPCGWSDLGTPARLERVLLRHGHSIDAAPHAPPAMRGHLDLAARARRGIRVTTDDTPHEVARNSTTMCHRSPEIPMQTANAVLDEIQEMFDRIDENGDGCISYEEYASLMLEMDHDQSGSALRASFDAIDADRDGRVSFGEFRAWVAR
jgi:mannose-1-phosphate guanylyltransferase